MAAEPTRRTEAQARLLGALSAAEVAAAARDTIVGRSLARVRRAADAVLGAREVSCRLFTGASMTVAVPEIVGDQLRRTGFIEPEVTRFLLEQLHPDAIFFDVGAQYGYHSIVAAEVVGGHGRVVAFEPGRSALRLLSANLRNVRAATVEALAVGDRDDTVTLQDFGVRNSALNTVRAAARVPQGERDRLRAESYAVDATTIDGYVRRTGLVPDVVKIDVEGEELAVLHGMEQTLREHAPLLSLETGDYPGMDSPPTVDSIDLLDRLGYDCMEMRGTLQPHRRRESYGYDNLFFVKRARPEVATAFAP